MKIKKIELYDHPFFGNTVFNFCDSSGIPFDNIIFAGENGCGKTQLLNIIYDFSSLSTSGTVSSEQRVFFCLLSQDELSIIAPHNLLSNPTGEIEITYDYSFNHNWSRLKIMYETKEDNGSLKTVAGNASTIFSNSDVKSIFSSIYSTVEINYDPKPAETVTSKDVDTEMVSSKKSGANLATEIQQLLIDCQANDANELTVWVKQNPGSVPPASVIDKRMTRFNNAFSTVFTTLSYDRIITESNHKKVIFKKDSTDIEISGLSSGEKQVVFRGAFLLQDQQSLKGCTVLIDEPEISLHPKWQEKILNFYIELFKDQTGTQTSQLFIATHSQYVLCSALMNRSNTQIFLLDSHLGTTAIRSVNAPFVLPAVTVAELNYYTFNITSIDYHIELYCYLQTKVSQALGKPYCTLTDCDNYICQQTQYYNPSIHAKSFQCNVNGKVITDRTLPTYIRNAIDHPDSGRTFSDGELKTSINLLVELCK